MGRRVNPLRRKCKICHTTFTTYHMMTVCCSAECKKKRWEKQVHAATMRYHKRTDHRHKREWEARNKDYMRQRNLLHKPLVPKEVRQCKVCGGEFIYPDRKIYCGEECYWKEHGRKMKAHYHRKKMLKLEMEQIIKNKK